MRRLFYSILLLCIITALAKGQQPASGDNWIPAGYPDMRSPFTAAVAGDGLCVLHLSNIQTSIYLNMSRWDGSSWEKLATVPCSSDVNAFVAYKGALYIGGRSHQKWGSLTGADGVVRWNGRVWEPVGDAPPDQGPGTALNTVFALVEFNGNLVAGGDFSSIGGVEAAGLAQWDGERWSPMQGPPGGTVYSLAAHNGRLYAALTSRSGIYEWDGTEWIDILGDPAARIGKIGVYNGDIFGIGDRVMIRERGVWRTLAEPGSWDNQTPPVATEHDGSLYVCRLTMAADGSGNNSIYRWNGREWSGIGPAGSNVNFLTEYNGELHAGGTFTLPGMKTDYNGVMRLCDEGKCARISGTIYHDMNDDCTQNGGEPGLEQRIVEILPGPYYASTDAQGRFSQLVPLGTYTVALPAALHWTSPCVKGPRTAVVQEPGSTVSGLDFTLSPEANIPDLRVSVASGRARPGFPLEYTITYENPGMVPTSGTLKFFHDPRLPFSSAAPTLNRRTPGVIEWDFSLLPVGASHSVKVTLFVPVSTPLGTQLCAHGEVEGTGIKAYKTNLRDDLCVTVTGSYDPNDIQVTPDGENGDGVLAERDSVLTYLIRFQNTGTDTAFTVVVTDTLARGHMPASIRLGAASHPYSFRLNSNGVMTWTFADIMLPDSNASERESHGYLKYSVRLRKGLKPGSQIPNRASIYFDFNEPVVTNTVVSIVPKSSGGGTDNYYKTLLQVYPNPAREHLTVDLPLLEGTVVELQNMLGQIVLRQPAGTDGKARFDVSSLPAGSYTVVIPVGDETYITEKIVLVR